jgi:hypothetical protein
MSLPDLSSICRKSLYFFASGYRLNPPSARCQSTSASATTFSVSIPPSTCMARPPPPTPAMFIFSFGDW